MHIYKVTKQTNMKKFFVLLIVVFATYTVKAQLNPVTWTFTAKKISDKLYEVHLKATLQTGWHLYSQIQPNDAIAMPTIFTLNNNPLLKPEGKIKEVGKIQKYHDAKLDISANQYSTSVDFVQMVKLKTNVKTNLSGNVEYQTCDDQKCLPPKKVNFSISIK